MKYPAWLHLTHPALVPHTHTWQCDHARHTGNTQDTMGLHNHVDQVEILKYHNIFFGGGDGGESILV